MRGEPITITPRFQQPTSVENKAGIRAKIEREMQEFFAAGGRIAEVPEGATGQFTKNFGAILMGYQSTEDLKRSGRNGCKASVQSRQSGRPKRSGK